MSKYAQSVVFAVLALLLLFCTYPAAIASNVTGQVWSCAHPNIEMFQSEHPYDNNLNLTWNVTASGGSRIRLHFVKIDVEDGRDYVHVEKSDGNEVIKYTGACSDFWTPWIDDTTAVIRLTSDTSITSYGFLVDKYITDNDITGVGGVTVTLSSGGGSAQTDANGQYTITNVASGGYTITPALSGYVFLPGSAAVSVSDDVDSTQDFECWENHVNSVSVAPNPFTPTGSNTALITAQGNPGNGKLLAKVTPNVSGTTTDRWIDLTEVTSGNYSNGWNGIDDNGCIVPNGDYTVGIYSENLNLFTLNNTITVNSISSVVVSQSTFYPSSGQSVQISVYAKSGMPLEARITDASGTPVDTLPLTWSGNYYTATWDGKNASDVIQPSGTYTIKIYRQDTGYPYAVSNSVAIGEVSTVTGSTWCGDQAVPVTVESTHPYANNLDGSTPAIITASSGTKIRVHFAKIATELNTDNIYVCDASGNVSTAVASYSGPLTNTWSPWVNGNTAIIKLISNASTTGYGYLIDKYITDDMVTPIPGATIKLTSGAYTGTTQTDGSYSIAGVVPGTYNVTPSLTGYIFSPTATSVTVTSTTGATADFEGWADSITSLITSPSPFIPDGTNYTQIQASGDAGQSGLYARVTGGSVDKYFNLVESSAGLYTATWDCLDDSTSKIIAGGNYSIKLYNKQSNQLSKTCIVVVKSITGVYTSPSTFYPAATPAGTTKITVTGLSGLSLKPVIYDSSGTAQRDNLALTWNSSTSAYETTWNGKDNNGNVLPAGAYTIKIYNSDTNQEYTASGTVSIGMLKGITGSVWEAVSTQTVDDIESPHPYDNSVTLTKTITASAADATRIRVHFKSIAVQQSADYVYLVDGTGATVATYTGNYSDVWSSWISGNSVTIKLVSNATVNGWGFKVDKYLTDKDTQPVEDVDIKIASTIRATTDANGQYSISNLSSGTYSITPVKTGWQFKTVPTVVTVTSTQGGTAEFECWKNSITTITASPSPFTPSGVITTTITATGITGLANPYLHITGNSMDNILDLNEDPADSGIYTAKWDCLDPSIANQIIAKGSYTIKAYNSFNNPFSPSYSLTVHGVTGVAVSLSTFYPSAGQSTIISVSTSILGLPLTAEINDSAGNVIRTLPLTLSNSVYKATWDGTDVNGTIQPAGSYTIKVYRSDNDNETKYYYIPTVSVTIGASASITGLVIKGATQLDPPVESTHPYPNNADTDFNISLPSGATKMRVHFAQIDTEQGYDYVYLKDDTDTTIATYSGTLAAFWSPWITGSITLTLESDGSQNAYGFQVDRIVADNSIDGAGGITIAYTPGSGTVTTGEDGTFTIPGLSPNTYTITPSQSGWQFTPGTASVTITTGGTGDVMFEGWHDFVTSVDFSPDPFTPTGNTADTAAITVVGSEIGQAGLYAKVFSDTFDTKIDLTETPTGSGNYIATWSGIDDSGSEPVIPVGGSFTVNIFSVQANQFSQFCKFTLKGINSVATDLSTFYPTTGTPLSITAAGASGLPVEVRIVNSNGSVVRTLTLTENSGSYTASWDGKNDTGTIQPVGAYSIYVYRTDSNVRYAASASVAIAPAAELTGKVWYGGNVLTNVIESAHNYPDNADQTWSISGTGGDKIKVHFTQIATESYK